MKLLVKPKQLSISWLIFSLIFIITLIIKILAVYGYNMPLTYDQGRDLMEIRSIVIGLRPALVGPTTSINGAFLGPFWYYFNIIPFIVGQGNPMTIIYWQILWYHVTGLILFVLLKNKHQSFALILSLLYLLMPMGFLAHRYFWNSHAMPMITQWLYISIFVATIKKKKVYALISGIISGIALQTQAAFGILLFPVTVISLILYTYKQTRKHIIQTKNFIIYSSAGFILTLIPQVIYEFRHQFPITSTLYQQFTGINSILGEKLSYTQIFWDRYQTSKYLLINTNHLPPIIVITLTILGTVYVIGLISTKKINLKKTPLLLPSIITLTLSLIFYLIFPQTLKKWYTFGLTIPLLTIQAVCLSYLWNLKPVIFKYLITIFITFTTYFTINAQLQYLVDSRQYNLNDPSNLSNQIQLIDWIYQHTDDQKFQIYTYLPSVYDYTYQHLFWWYGDQEYGYLPTLMSYSAKSVPEYIKSSDKLIIKNNSKQIQQITTFLIIEPDLQNPQKPQRWINNFNQLCIQEEVTFPWKTKVQLRKPCHIPN